MGKYSTTNNKFDLTIVGNSSLDTITNINKITKTIPGGSAFNIFTAASFYLKHINIYTKIGYDFPENLTLKSVDKIEKPSNRFLIDEIKSTITFPSPLLPLTPPKQLLATNHLHLSLRSGVNTPLNWLKNCNYKTASIDVMFSSLKDKLTDLQQCLPYCTIFFVNNGEFKTINQNFNLNKLNPDLTIFITKGHLGIDLIYNHKKYSIDTISTPINSTFCTTGAGDTFIGGLLTNLINNQNFAHSISYAMAMAAISVENFGVKHLNLKTNRFRQLAETIYNKNKWNKLKYVTFPG